MKSSDGFGRNIWRSRGEGAVISMVRWYNEVEKAACCWGLVIAAAGCKCHDEMGSVEKLCG